MIFNITTFYIYKGTYSTNWLQGKCVLHVRLCVKALLIVIANAVTRSYMQLHATVCSAYYMDPCLHTYMPTEVACLRYW